jgi:hypothetical protein
MPSWKELWVVCVVASLCAVTVVLVLHALGYGDHAVIAAAVSGSTSAGVASMQFRESAESNCDSSEVI